MKAVFCATNYPSDLTDFQWEQIEKYFPQGCNSVYHKRSLIDAALYLTANRLQWKVLPRDFPPYPTVHTFYRRACASGAWDRVLEVVWQNPGGKNARCSNQLMK